MRTSVSSPLVVVGILFALAIFANVSGHGPDLRYLVTGLMVVGWVLAVRSAPRWGPRIAFVGTLAVILAQMVPTIFR